MIIGPTYQQLFVSMYLMHWRSYRPSLLTTTAGSSVASERQVVGMTGRVLSEGRR